MLRSGLDFKVKAQKSFEIHTFVFGEQGGGGSGGGATLPATHDLRVPRAKQGGGVFRGVQ